ncbi:OmpA family protein [Massilia sp. PAMC28688]|uniref:OmpA family protein n=1 Tax=Massilia sp. PAMC28688 TaxID=2861283 RepID=UPI001C627161|nr:OmpA family protein [Massilia sp. PAMC28688]QYF95720.1 OmpA family protein [Massilia sp. PAMC28688]
MKIPSLLAACILAAALPAQGQETPVIGEGQAEMGVLVDALAPKAPVRTRGIGLARDKAAAKPAAPAKVSLLITFEPNSAALTASSRQSLEVVGQALASEKLSPFRFAIEGHADPRGLAANNLKLSQLRAESVRAYLVNTMQIDGARLDAIGKGDRELMNKAVPEAPENRRVTIVNLSR